ncbi:MAG: hypothetical protein WC854_14115, partial [Bacteroidales bacterium]
RVKSPAFINTFPESVIINQSDKYFISVLFATFAELKFEPIVEKLTKKGSCKWLYLRKILQNVSWIF